MTTKLLLIILILIPFTVFSQQKEMNPLVSFLSPPQVYRFVNNNHNVAPANSTHIVTAPVKNEQQLASLQTNAHVTKHGPDVGQFLERLFLYKRSLPKQAKMQTGLRGNVFIFTLHF